MTTELITIETQALDFIAGQRIDQNPAIVYLGGLGTPRSKATMQQSLDVIAGLLGCVDCYAVPWGEIRFQHTQAIRARLAESYAPATANRILSAMRGTLKAAWRLGFMDAEDYHRACDVGNVTGETIPAGRELSPGEISGLMVACENDLTHAGARDAAIIALMYTGGLRRAEVVSLDLEDYDQEAGRLVIRGKRNKERTAYLVNGAALAMGDWLNIRGDESGALFQPINRGGNIQNRRMSNQAVYNILAKRGSEAALKDFSPHDMRRTFVSDLLDAGADIATVAKMAGHASVNTTARYDRRPEQAKQKAAGLLHVPYRGRLT